LGDRVEHQANVVVGRYGAFKLQVQQG
jgi:hypothetical protein